MGTAPWILALPPLGSHTQRCRWRTSSGGSRLTAAACVAGPLDPTAGMPSGWSSSDVLTSGIGQWREAASWRSASSDSASGGLPPAGRPPATAGAAAAAAEGRSGSAAEAEPVAPPAASGGVPACPSPCQQRSDARSEQRAHSTPVRRSGCSRLQRTQSARLQPGGTVRRPVPGCLTCGRRMGSVQKGVSCSPNLWSTAVQGKRVGEGKAEARRRQRWSAALVEARTQRHAAAAANNGWQVQHATGNSG